MVDPRPSAHSVETQRRRHKSQTNSKLAGPEPALPAVYTSPPRALVGRQGAADAISAAIENLDQCRLGNHRSEPHGRVMIVRGDVGSGRTATVAHSCSNRADTGARLRVGVAEREQGSYGAILQAFPELRPTIRRVAAGEPSTERSVVAQQTLRIVQHLARDKPLVVVIEDVDAADSQTLHVLRSMIAPSLPGNVLVIVTCPATGDADRDDADDWRAVADFMGGDRGEVIELAGLGLTDIERMVAARHHDQPQVPRARLARQILRLSQGNAYIASILCRDAPVAMNALRVPDATEPTITIGTHLRRKIREPLLEDLLTTAALIGPRFDRRLLASVLGASRDDTVARLARCADLDLCHPVGDGTWQFDHPFVVDYFRARMPLLRPLVLARIAEHELAANESMSQCAAGTAGDRQAELAHSARVPDGEARRAS